ILVRVGMPIYQHLTGTKLLKKVLIDIEVCQKYGNNKTLSVKTKSFFNGGKELYGKLDSYCHIYHFIGSFIYWNRF
ncbi:hypothetical protein AAULH_13496, partial [Lactobacillus helveticus MTCC 5463]